MQPTTQTKPVMDVAAPRGPVSAPSTAWAPTAAPAVSPSSELPVHPAPLNSPASQPAAARPALPVASMPHLAHKAASAALPQHRTPVGLITVTVFVMIVLSALAVTVYVTSRTA